MKSIVSIIFACTLLGAANLVMAHGDHMHSQHFINTAEAQEIALNSAKRLTHADMGLGFGQLPKTWANLPMEKTKIERRLPGFFVVSVVNDEEKKTLFVLISSQGEPYDANFTGKFQALQNNQ